jgi:hypothetical protein
VSERERERASGRTLRRMKEAIVVYATNGCSDHPRWREGHSRERGGGGIAISLSLSLSLSPSLSLFTLLYSTFSLYLSLSLFSSLSTLFSLTHTHLEYLGQLHRVPLPLVVVVNGGHQQPIRITALYYIIYHIIVLYHYIVCHSRLSSMSSLNHAMPCYCRAQTMSWPIKQQPEPRHALPSNGLDHGMAYNSAVRSTPGLAQAAWGPKARHRTSKSNRNHAMACRTSGGCKAL